MTRFSSFTPAALSLLLALSTVANALKKPHQKMPTRPPKPKRLP